MKAIWAVFVIAVIILAVAAVGLRAANAATNNFYKYGSIEDLADAIHEKKFVDDSINWAKYKDWTPFKLASDDLQDCLKHRHDLSSNLADYEVYDCYEKEEE